MDTIAQNTSELSNYEYSAISRSVAEKNQVQLLDLRNIFKDHLRSHNPLDRSRNILTTDGVHLNKAGNDFLAEQMLMGLGFKDYRSKPVSYTHLTLPTKA